MTEDEAKTKWCPFVQFHTGDDGESSTNRDRYVLPQASVADTMDRVRHNARCIASECMAWQATDNEIKQNPQSPVEDGYARDASDYVSAGYCGLAGK